MAKKQRLMVNRDKKNPQYLVMMMMLMMLAIHKFIPQDLVMAARGKMKERNWRRSSGEISLFNQDLLSLFLSLTIRWSGNY